MLLFQSVTVVNVVVFVIGAFSAAFLRINNKGEQLSCITRESG